MPDELVDRLAGHEFAVADALHEPEPREAAGYLEIGRFGVLEVLQALLVDVLDGVALLQPQYQWGSRIANAPPNIAYPGFLDWNYTHDVALAVTKVWRTHG